MEGARGLNLDRKHAQMYTDALARLLRELVCGGETAVVAVHNFLGTRIAGREHVHMPPELLLAVIRAVAPAARCACMHIQSCMRSGISSPLTQNLAGALTRELKSTRPCKTACRLST
jgi:hypothetical protein